MPALPAATDPSVAVLAFADMSPARDQGYFCEGTAEEIINALAGVRGLRVASRSGSFQFKDRAVDNREVARLLQVRAILDGSVRRAGDRVRVAAALVAADGTCSGRRPSTVASRTSSPSRRKSLVPPCARCASSCSTTTRRGSSAAGPTTLTRTSSSCAVASSCGARRRPNSAAAAQFFRESIRLDPQFAEAHAALAKRSGPLVVLAWATGRSSSKTRGTASLRALELAPGLAAAHVARAQVLAIDDRQA